MNSSKINLISKIIISNGQRLLVKVQNLKSPLESCRFYIQESFMEIGKIPTVNNEPPYHTTELISTAISTNSLRERTMAPLNSTKPDDPQVSPISLFLSLPLSLISFPRSVWLLRKYTIIEQQGFENFSDQPNSRQPNRVLAVEYYRKHGFFFFFFTGILWF